MSLTKGTYSRNKFKKVIKSSDPETDEGNSKPTRTGMFDFSSNKAFCTLTLPQVVTFMVFVFGVGWFLASNWFFSIRSNELKQEIQNEILPQIRNLKNCLSTSRWLDPKCLQN